MSTQVPPLVASSTSKIGRQSADFPPDSWENEFLTYPNDFKETDQGNEKLLELKQEIGRMLMADVTEVSQKLELIDIIQRLGIFYHFENEINEILKKIQKDQYEYDLKNDYDDDLSSTSLRFRLLRQHGYRISSDVFNKFKSIDGNFKESLTTDVKGLLNLYEASYLRVHGEDILDEALDFSSKHLQSMPTQTCFNASVAKQIKHTLNRSLRKGLPRVEARFYIEVYEEDPLHNEVILTFAKMDFNIVQKLHQKELSDIVRWWKNSDYPRKLSFMRDRMVEMYFWAMGFYFEPKYTLARRTLAKLLIMITILDDIYDVYGTIEELEHLTKAIERWNFSAIDTMPEYMKYCCEALLDIYNEIEKDIAFGETAYRFGYAKELLRDIIRNYLIEARWCNQQYVPTVEEYMEVGLPTGGRIFIPAASILGMEKIATKEAFEWVFREPKITNAASTIARLMNDMAGHKVEQKRIHVASIVECYMKQHGLSEEETTNLLLKTIENAWKDINEEYLKRTNVPVALLDRVLSFVRVMEFFYEDEDSFTQSYLIKNQIASLLKDPVPI